MQEIAFDLGYGEKVKVGQLMNSLNEDSNFLYSDTPDRKKRVVADYKSIVEETWNISELYFHNMPKSKVEVRAVPEYSEQNQAGGYYMSPALDGSRPGVFYANLYDIKQTPKLVMLKTPYNTNVALIKRHLKRRHIVVKKYRGYKKGRSYIKYIILFITPE